MYSRYLITVELSKGIKSQLHGKYHARQYTKKSKFMLLNLKSNTSREKQMVRLKRRYLYNICVIMEIQVAKKRVFPY